MGLLRKLRRGQVIVNYGILLCMQLSLVHVGSHAGRKDEFEALTQEYLARCSAYAACTTQAFKTEAALLAWIGKQKGRTPAITVLLDGRGKQMSSEAMATWLGRHRDEGAQHVVFAVGPADGWSEDARKGASMLLSLGPMTLAHALARLVIAEQIYRAFTILAGHPYHRQ
jgi:23S rRNA (pseudouridine1915-N3)-methyltransferase